MNSELNETCFTRAVLNAAHRHVMPIAVYPGLALTSGTVGDIVTNAAAQVSTQVALRERYGTSFVLSAMDLSAEAEAFGCTVHFSDHEVPTVTGRLVTDLDGARRLAVPIPGDKRTAVHLDAVRGLRKLPGAPFVLGGCIGPFSLAARLTGVSEAMELTVTEPQLMHSLIEKSATFLNAYLRAFRDAGADGVIMAEPAAGLLSPRALAAFSSAYIKPLGESVADGHFALILHNCAAKLPHLPMILESGLRSFHFGAPMDLPAALAKVSSGIVLCGNLDPAGMFCQAAPEHVQEAATGLLRKTASFRNFVLSSGCDLPAGTKLENLDAFFQAANTPAMNEAFS